MALTQLAAVGVTGLAVMGTNLARNGHVIAVHDRSGGKTRALVEGHGDEGTFVAAESSGAWATTSAPIPTVRSTARGRSTRRSQDVAEVQVS
jgi:hypothetical protein